MNDCIDSKPTRQERKINSNQSKTPKLRENQCGQDISSFPGSKHQEKAKNLMPQSTTKVTQQTSTESEKISHSILESELREKYEHLLWNSSTGATRTVSNSQRLQQPTTL